MQSELLSEELSPIFNSFVSPAKYILFKIFSLNNFNSLFSSGVSIFFEYISTVPLLSPKAKVGTLVVPI